MGGRGSSRWLRHEAKRLVEHTFHIDLLHPRLLPLHRNPAPAAWSITLTLDDVRRGWLAHLSAAEADGSRDLTLRGLPLDIHESGQVIRLVRVKAGFDQRALAECPTCDRRVQILHALPEDGFQCRSCLALGYRSSREWDGRVSRLAKVYVFKVIRTTELVS